jgi:hypothetical protein
VHRTYVGQVERCERNVTPGQRHSDVLISVDQSDCVRNKSSQANHSDFVSTVCSIDFQSHIDRNFESIQNITALTTSPPQKVVDIPRQLLVVYWWKKELASTFLLLRFELLF